MGCPAGADGSSRDGQTRCAVDNSGCERGGVIRVLVVSDVRLYREGLSRLLAATGRVEVVAAVADVLAGVRTGRRLAPRVLVVHMVSQAGTGVVQELAAGVPDAKIVVLALRQEGAEIISYAQAGASGYLSLEGSLDDLVLTIEGVTKGEAFVSPRVAGALFRHVQAAAENQRRSERAPLTRREVEVVAFVERGLTNREIARSLGISPATVKNHVHAILAKLELSCRTEAAAWARVHLAGQLSRLASST